MTCLMIENAKLAALAQKKGTNLSTQSLIIDTEISGIVARSLSSLDSNESKSPMGIMDRSFTPVSRSSLQIEGLPNLKRSNSPDLSASRCQGKKVLASVGRNK